MDKYLKNKFLKFGLYGLIGGVLGYSYYYFIGCTSGGCPLTSNWHITTGYGLVSGLILALPQKKRADETGR